jgi:hypothetical protein
MRLAAVVMSRASSCAVSLLSLLLSSIFQSSLGYEHYDARSVTSDEAPHDASRRAALTRLSALFGTDRD